MLGGGQSRQSRRGGALSRPSRRCQSDCHRRIFASKGDAQSRYGSPLWIEDLARLPTTFDVFGEHEPSWAEQELFVRKLREDGARVEGFMMPSVSHDVGAWLKVSGNLAAHEAAVGFIRRGFAPQQ